MVKVTRFDGSQFYVNAELIEFIEATPDTVISLTNHHKLLVREAAEAVVEQVIAYHRQVHRGSGASLVSPTPTPAVSGEEAP